MLTHVLSAFTLIITLEDQESHLIQSQLPKSLLGSPDTSTVKNIFQSYLRYLNSPG